LNYKNRPSFIEIYDELIDFKNKLYENYFKIDIEYNNNTNNTNVDDEKSNNGFSSSNNTEDEKLNLLSINSK
jgi:hypothetical protein